MNFWQFTQCFNERVPAVLQMVVRKSRTVCFAGRLLSQNILFPMNMDLQLSELAYTHLQDFDVYIEVITLPTNSCEQSLFRKIAGALPGMESVNPSKQDDYVDINLKTTSNNTQSEGQTAGGCAC